MKIELPISFKKWLISNHDRLVVPLGGYIESVRFRCLEDVEPIILNISVDEYATNHTEVPSHLKGNYYPVPAVDLLAEVSGYYADGVLVWVPMISEFATYDNDHCVLRSFPKKSWDEIVKSLEQFIDSQWNQECQQSELVCPWNDSRFSSLIPTKTPG